MEARTGNGHFLEAISYAAVDHAAYVAWLGLETLGQIVPGPGYSVE